VTKYTGKKDRKEAQRKLNIILKEENSNKLLTPSETLCRRNMAVMNKKRKLNLAVGFSFFIFVSILNKPELPSIPTSKE
jgi:hypothetical protein